MGTVARRPEFKIRLSYLGTVGFRKFSIPYQQNGESIYKP